MAPQQPVSLPIMGDPSRSPSSTRDSVHQSQEKGSLSNSRDAAFFQWLREAGTPFLERTSIAEFPATGRGLCAETDLQSFDPMVAIPKALLLRTDDNEHPFMQAYKEITTSSKSGCSTISTTELWKKVEIDIVLVLLLLFEKCIVGADSFWAPYFDVLPEWYNTPASVVFGEEGEKDHGRVDEATTSTIAISAKRASRIQRELDLVRGIWTTFFMAAASPPAQEQGLTSFESQNKCSESSLFARMARRALEIRTDDNKVVETKLKDYNNYATKDRLQQIRFESDFLWAQGTVWTRSCFLREARESTFDGNNKVLRHSALVPYGDMLNCDPRCGSSSSGGGDETDDGSGCTTGVAGRPFSIATGSSRRTPKRRTKPKPMCGLQTLDATLETLDDKGKQHVKQHEEDEQYFIFRASRNVKKGSECFITYGNKTNFKYLLTYGFSPHTTFNPYDLVKLRAADLVHTPFADSRAPFLKRLYLEKTKACPTTLSVLHCYKLLDGWQVFLGNVAGTEENAKRTCGRIVEQDEDVIAAPNCEDQNLSRATSFPDSCSTISCSSAAGSCSSSKASCSSPSVPSSPGDEHNTSRANSPAVESSSPAVEVTQVVDSSEIPSEEKDKLFWPEIFSFTLLAFLRYISTPGSEPRREDDQSNQRGGVNGTRRVRNAKMNTTSSTDIKAPSSSYPGKPKTSSFTASKSKNPVDPFFEICNIIETTETDPLNASNPAHSSWAKSVLLLLRDLLATEYASCVLSRMATSSTTSSKSSQSTSNSTDHSSCSTTAFPSYMSKEVSMYVQSQGCQDLLSSERNKLLQLVHSLQQIASSS
ncbi:unnamed protein product [Amoebophrya sp. A25]|nr:unnamed protein product [Amoebophrya sp. A25]|eukprot:GSA25T00017210001.1